MHSNQHDWNAPPQPDYRGCRTEKIPAGQKSGITESFSAPCYPILRSIPAKGQAAKLGILTIDQDTFRTAPEAVAPLLP